MKIHKSASNYIIVKDEANKYFEVKSSVFDRLGVPSIHFSVFDSIGTQSNVVQKSSVFLLKIDIESQ